MIKAMNGAACIRVCLCVTQNYGPVRNLKNWVIGVGNFGFCINWERV